MISKYSLGSAKQRTLTYLLKSRLRRLPAELRLKIYQYAFTPMDDRWDSHQLERTLLSGTLLTSRFFFKDAHQTFLDLTGLDICYRSDNEIYWSEVWDPLKFRGPQIMSRSRVVGQEIEDTRLCCCKDMIMGNVRRAGDIQHGEFKSSEVNIIWRFHMHRVLTNDICCGGIARRLRDESRARALAR